MTTPDAGLDRRELLHGFGLAAALATTAAAADPAGAAPVTPAEGQVRLAGRAIRVIDLTHRLTKAFNFGQTNPPRFGLEAVDGSGKAVGMKLNRLSLVEHTGTHIDAPSHFGTGGRSLGEIPVADLVVPLVVLDFRQRRTADGNAQVGMADIEAWERRHGRLPAGCCVAMWSGFDPIATVEEAMRTRRNFDAPGFAPEVVAMLKARAVKGVATDTGNIDSNANSPAFPFHQQWLATGGWGIENITNLGAVPAKGAVLIVGAAPVDAATGMPVRAIALV